jgi:hypothetical protein
LQIGLQFNYIELPMSLFLEGYPVYGCLRNLLTRVEL